MGNILNKTCSENQIKTRILCPKTFYRKSRRLGDNVEKHNGDRGATNDVTTWRIRVACWLSNAARTHEHAHNHAPQRVCTCARARARTQKYVIFITFLRQQRLAIAPHCYVTHTSTLAVLFVATLPVSVWLIARNKLPLHKLH
jgi:hypothetical protein